ncbi:hypothetical protein GM415_11870 [Pseudodesulfovibrio cashew]|uniref:Uncharacterized protein n=1 Tax=Pseudodesulfovibrio cashew TaxID=2678688 RepID=A0A6I6JF39_9BACT|nr:hypothetical protein [Pseudodesulfovibrio cashew]QGY40791.1 hypothetical protein GM415_11870 [Pseudodesulfovibrio cashew]
MVIHEYAGIVTELEDRNCPHCGKPMEPWLPPPETGWDVILICNSNSCPFYLGSEEDIAHKRPGSHLGCRYALNPQNGYKPVNVLAVCPH